MEMDGEEMLWKAGALHGLLKVFIVEKTVTKPNFIQKD